MSNNEILGKVNIKREIFLRDSFSRLWFVIALPMTLKETERGYQQERNEWSEDGRSEAIWKKQKTTKPFNLLCAHIFLRHRYDVQYE